LYVQELFVLRLVGKEVDVIVQ